MVNGSETNTATTMATANAGTGCLVKPNGVSSTPRSTSARLMIP